MAQSPDALEIVEAQCTLPEGRSPELEALLALPEALWTPDDDAQLLGLLAASSTYDTLRARSNQYGRYTRPEGTCSNPPPYGTSIPWVLCQPNQDNLVAKKRLGWGNLGSIGNLAHLKRCGDHTGHSYGKKVGHVYADDTADPAWLEDVLVDLCRMDDYDTRWLAFWNCNGNQYNYAGRRVAGSADYHLHTSTREGWELHRQTLFYDAYRHYRGWPLLNGRQVDNPLAPPEEDMDLKDLVQNFPPEAAEEFPESPMNDLKAWVETCLSHGLWQSYRAARDSAAALKVATETKSAVDQLAVGGIDYAALAKAVVDEQHRRLAE